MPVVGEILDIFGHRLWRVGVTPVFGKASARPAIIFGQQHYFHRHLPENSIFECRRSTMVEKTFGKNAEVLFSAMRKRINCKC